MIDDTSYTYYSPAIARPNHIGDDTKMVERIAAAMSQVAMKVLCGEIVDFTKAAQEALNNYELKGK